MNPETEKRITDAVLKSTEVESLLNREGNALPFGYHNPETEGKLIWMCNYDAEGRITSVFSFDKGTHREANTNYLKDMDEAISVRDELVNHGWKKMEAPKATFSYAGDDKPLNRKQRRYLKRKIEQMDRRTNPYKDEEKLKKEEENKE